MSTEIHGGDNMETFMITTYTNQHQQNPDENFTKVCKNGKKTLLELADAPIHVGLYAPLFWVDTSY